MGIPSNPNPNPYNDPFVPVPDHDPVPADIDPESDELPPDNPPLQRQDGVDPEQEEVAPEPEPERDDENDLPANPPLGYPKA